MYYSAAVQSRGGPIPLYTLEEFATMHKKHKKRDNEDTFAKKRHLLKKRFVDWIPDSISLSQTDTPLEDYALAGSCLANHSYIGEQMKRISEEY